MTAIALGAIGGFDDAVPTPSPQTTPWLDAVSARLERRRDRARHAASDDLGTARTSAPPDTLVSRAGETPGTEAPEASDEDETVYAPRQSLLRTPPPTPTEAESSTLPSPPSPGALAPSFVTAIPAVAPLPAPPRVPQLHPPQVAGPRPSRREEEPADDDVEAASLPTAAPPDATTRPPASPTIPSGTSDPVGAPSDPPLRASLSPSPSPSPPPTSPVRDRDEAEPSPSDADVAALASSLEIPSALDAEDGEDGEVHLGASPDSAEALEQEREAAHEDQPSSPPAPATEREVVRVGRVVDPDVDAADPDAAREPDYMRVRQHAPTAAAWAPTGGAPRRPWWRRLALGAGIAAATVAVAVTLVPHYLLSRQSEATSACFEGIASRGDGDPTRCLPAPALTRALELLPWFEADALALDASSGKRALGLAVALATAGHPDAAARRAAAEAIHARYQKPARPDASPGYAILAGDFDDLVRFGRASDDKPLRRLALDAARSGGAVEALADLARGLDPSEDAAGDLKQGALLCLLGDHEAGGALVTAAAQTQKRSSGEALPGADLAFVGCGAASAATDPTARDAAAWAATLGEPSVAAIDRVEALLDESQDLAPNLRLRLAALVVAARDDLSPVATLRLFTPREGAPAGLDAATYLSPWTVLADRRTAPASLPALETSIARLERLLGELSDHDEPLVCRGEDCPREASLESPADTLRRLLFALLLEHAAEALRRGGRDAAKASLLAAEPHAAVHDRHLLGPLWLAVGEPRRALDAVESRSDLLAQLTRSFALRDLDRLDDAEAAAAAGYAAAQRDGDEQAVTFGWLWAALALERGSSDRLRAALAEATSQGEAELADWLALAGMPEAERLPLRYDAELEDPPLAALPAVVAVVARAVPPDADVEVWLDRVLADRHRSHPATTWLARAKAAELRGDRTAAATARARGLRLLELAKDDRASLLLDLAGLR